MVKTVGLKVNRLKKIEYYAILILLLILLSGCRANQFYNQSATEPLTEARPTIEIVLPTETQNIDANELKPTEIPSEISTEIQNENKIELVRQFPDPNEYFWKEVFSGLIQPLGMAAINDGSGRILILEQEGVIRLLENGNANPAPFLDIRDRIKILGSEQGLLGIALAPDFNESGIFYLNYTNRKGESVIARYNASEDLYAAFSESEQILLVQEQPYKNHNGGNIVFGPDGFLYAGFGDGGSGGDPQQNAQNTNTLLGKMLRIAVTGQTGYAIPSDNPYVEGGGKGEIWATGLRNPWRFSFDRLTGDLYIADVGQGDWEEINYTPANTISGVNFGWDIREGNHPYEGTIPNKLQLTDPVTEYGHDQGCSVTGGFVYRGTELPEWQGIYFFGDYCSGTVWGLYQDQNEIWQVQLLFNTGENISSFGEGANGELYLIGYVGKLYILSHK